MSFNAPIAEDEMVASAQQGDVAAFNKLVALYEQRVFSLAYRMLGEAESATDATQDCFFQAYRALNQYRGGSFKSWLFRIASNICYDRLRYRNRRPSTSLDELVETAEETGGNLLTILEDSSGDPEDISMRQETLREVAAALNLLPPEQKLVLVLSDVQGLSYEEIVQITGQSLGTVKSRLSRGRTKLREFLAKAELLPKDLRH